MRMQNEEHGEDMAMPAQQQAWEGALWEHRSTKAPRLGAGRLTVPGKWALRSLRQLRDLDPLLGLRH